jgi:hypothetical protein
MSLKVAVLEMAFAAEATITEGQILKLGAADRGVTPAAAATDKLFGVACHDAASAATVRVALMGEAVLKAGGTIARGDLLTSNASGLAIAAAPATGINNRIVGVAIDAAVSGDLFSALLSQSEKQGL